ncbi:MAG: hypothetical protein A2V88_02105 [Elusimicrobia bacterium RBG_16_66_12]|nr:MAG: hypothetical protein A2V88_02105 [Elusimicrobia bacterium RBG_16_66_12]
MPSSLRRRAAALGLLLTLAQAPAHALSRSGSLLWRYDDITSRDPSGRRRRSSWYQGYSLDVGGVFLHPFVGTFQTGGSYTQGADIDTAVNSDVSEQRIIACQGAFQPFSPALRNFFTLDPNYSLQRTKYAASSLTPEHTYTSRNWGYNSSLNLPRLPALSASRQYNALRDLDSPNPTDQRLNTMRESLYYRLGGVSLNFSQNRTRTEDLRANTPSLLDTTQWGSLDYSRGEIKALGIKSLSVHADYLRTARSETSTQKTVTNLLNVRSRDFRSGAWTHALNYWNDAQRDILRRTTLMTHNGQWTSNRPVQRGSITNILSGNAATGRGGSSRGASVAPGVNLSFYDGRLLTVTNGQAGLSRAAAGDTTFSDSLGSRVDLKPRQALNLFAEARTSGVEALNSGGTGGQRTHRLGLGGDRRFSQVETTLRYDRTEQREFSSGAKSASDQVNLSGSATPAEGLRATAGYNYTTSKSDLGSRTSSRNARAGLDYSLRWGLRLYADASFAANDQYTANCGAGYALGKTALNLKFTHTEYSSSSSYSYLSISLSRAL